MLPLFFVSGLFLYKPLMSYILQKQVQAAVPAASPAAFTNLVVSGVIDASNDIIHVPTLQSGILEHINVSVGQKVKKGEALFSLYHVQAENAVKSSKVSLKQAKNELRIREKSLQHGERHLARLKSLDRRAISLIELRDKSHEINMGKIQVRQAKYNVALAEANLKNAELALSQATVTAPIDGVVLQINGRAHEFINGSQTVLWLGDAQKTIVRVSIDERDISRFLPKEPAYFYNNLGVQIPLTFMQLDHYIVASDRLNARVQEALYYFDRDRYPDFVSGQIITAVLTGKATV